MPRGAPPPIYADTFAAPVYPLRPSFVRAFRHERLLFMALPPDAEEAMSADSDFHDAVSAVPPPLIHHHHVFCASAG
jgi:hypothetical protein